MVNKFFRSQNGFAIVQGLMLAAAVAGMAYVGTKMITDQRMAEKGVESKSKLEQLHASIYSILQNQENCLATVNHLTNTRPTGAESWGEFNNIITAGNTTPIFVSQAYDATKFYMGRSIVINSMALKYTSYPIVQRAVLRIEYAKLEDENVNRRTGKGYGSKSITKNIQITATSDGATGIKSCYAVNVGENETLVKDFCNELGADTNATTAGDTLFTWDETYNRCVIKDLKCPSGRVFAGWDSNGGRRCNEIKDWMNLGNVLDTSPVLCPKNSTSVKFVILPTGKAQIQCSGAVTSCTSSCDCPGMHDVCLSNVCVNQDPPTICTNGAFSRGDNTCQLKCVSGAWVCPFPKTICGAPTATTCPNVMALTPIQSQWSCNREIAGKCGWRSNVQDCKVGACGVSDGTGCTIPTRTADPWVMGQSAMPCANYVPTPTCDSMGL